MNPDEFDRNLSRLRELAAAARGRLEGLGREVQSLRAIIAEVEVGLAASRAAGKGSDEEAGHGTTDTSVPQAEVLSK